MIISRCCKQSVHVYHANEGTSFYVCNGCERACDTISSTTRMEHDYDVSRNGSEVEAISD